MNQSALKRTGFSCRSWLQAIPATSLLILALLTSLHGLHAWSDEASGIDYEAEIKSLLRDRCFACHGALNQEADLRVDTVGLMRRGGDSGPAILAGDSDESLLLQRVADPDPDTRMPPEGEPLSVDQLRRLEIWIKAGARGPDDEQPEPDPGSHWAFQPIVRPPIPELETAWGHTALDQFVARNHQRHGLQPQHPLPWSLLIRRLYIDLLGVPPSPLEINAWLSELGDDPARIETNYRRLIDRLLDDPRHGQRWARHWMDIWRYSDWYGLGKQLRNSQLHIWHWRDWIVQSLNADLPYDEMVRLMLAADELAPGQVDSLRASGFLARHFNLFNRHQWLDQTVEHVSKGFLGLTMNCYKCHDHKYDPLPQTAYYQMRAFFEPYHVRLDMLPDSSDLTQHGLPRVFDALLDQPTYLFVRGEETRPDTSQAITPGLPEALGGIPLAIEPVALPAVAWQPERQQWVATTYREEAERAVQEAEVQWASARQAVDRAKQDLALLSNSIQPKASTDQEVAVDHDNRTMEKFTSSDSPAWEALCGDWHLESGRLRQRTDGPTRSVIRWKDPVPQQLHATLKFTTHTGSRWRSVGIAFDVARPPADSEAGDCAPSDHHFVYVSAVDGGSKVQIAYRQSGTDHYPANSRREMPIQLNRTYELQVLVRDQLINVYLDDQLLLAWHSPMPRRAGDLHFTTFDAVADFHEITVRPLHPQTPLRLPQDVANALPTNVPEAEAALQRARAKQQLALASFELAQANLDSLIHRIEAFQLQWRSAGQAASADNSRAADDDDPSDELRQAFQQAILAERQAQVAVAARGLAEAERKAAEASDPAAEDLTRELQIAQQRLADARSALDAPIDPQQLPRPLTGAKWSATRFHSSGSDDPEISFPAESSGRRRALADWITDSRNPLTARVAVNHIWARHFGTPLVPTVFDFGRAGTPPADQELLDWLAAELIDSGWSMKHLHRMIVVSETYRLSSSITGRAENQQADPDNRYWWRRLPQRLESQVIRDAILELAGQLDLQHDGPSIPASQQDRSPRRSLYFFHSNNDRNLFLTMFDEAEVGECYRRQESIVPQQALALTNSRLVLDALDPIADRLAALATRDCQDTGDAACSDNRYIRAAFVGLLNYVPDTREQDACRHALVRWRDQEGLTPAQARQYLVWTLLNHNDFVTLR